MAIKSRKCSACKTSYSYCPDCIGADRLAPAWKSEFCCSECKDLWYTATKFNMGKLTKAEAKTIISALDLKPADQYVACIQRDLQNILAEEPKPKRGKRATLSIFDEAIKPEIKAETKLPEVAAPTVIEEITSVIEPVLTEEIAIAADVSHEVVIEKEENE